MIRKLLLTCFASVAIAAQAAPNSFSAWQFDVGAIAVTDGVPDAMDAMSVTDSIDVSAGSTTDLAVATSGAFAGPGLLTTSADVSSSGSLSSAVASAHFLGSFLNDGRVLLNIDFVASDFDTGSGQAASSLFVNLTSGTMVVFRDYLSSSRLFDYMPAAGTTSVLELTLTSEASAGFSTSASGGAYSFGMVSVTSPVPEPQAAALLASGLTLLMFMRRGIRRRLDT